MSKQLIINVVFTNSSTWFTLYEESINSSIIKSITPCCLGFKNRRRSSRTALVAAVKHIVYIAAKESKPKEIRMLKIFISSFTRGPATVLRAFISEVRKYPSLALVDISDITASPHNGCKPKKNNCRYDKVKF